MSQSFVLSKKALRGVIKKVENDRAARDDRKANANARAERKRLEREVEAARIAAEKLAVQQYEQECKTVNAIRRKGGNVISLNIPCRIHVPTFTAALAHLGLDSCDLLAYVNLTQRKKAAKLYANTLADALHMAYPSANMKRKHPMFMGVV